MRGLRIEIGYLCGYRSEQKLILLEEHDSPHWYDIVHFEHKLSCGFALGFLKRPRPKEKP